MTFWSPKSSVWLHICVHLDPFKGKVKVSYFTQDLYLLLFKGIPFSSATLMDLSFFFSFHHFVRDNKAERGWTEKIPSFPFFKKGRRSFHMFNLDFNFFTGLVIQMLSLQYRQTIKNISCSQTLEISMINCMVPLTAHK